jgi:hypothetical protein
MNWYKRGTQHIEDVRQGEVCAPPKQACIAQRGGAPLDDRQHKKGDRNTQQAAESGEQTGDSRQQIADSRQQTAEGRQ